MFQVVKLVCKLYNKDVDVYARELPESTRQWTDLVRSTDSLLNKLCHQRTLKGSGHYWYLLKIIIIIKTYLVTSNGELLIIVDSVKHCEKQLPLK